MTIRVPHPAYFALHKLIIFQRRKNAEKMAKDKEMALQILSSLMAKGEEGTIRKAFDSAPAGWQKKIVKGMDSRQEKEILSILSRGK